MFGNSNTGRILTRSRENEVDLWELYNGSHAANLLAKGGATSLSEITRAFRSVVQTPGGGLNSYDMIDGKLIAILPTNGRVLGWGFSSDGEGLITGSVGNSLLLWYPCPDKAGSLNVLVMSLASG
jgi:WD40 repeat protein